MTLAALAAAMVFPLGSAYGGEVTDGALIYQGEGHEGSVIRRLQLDSGMRSTIYAAPNRRTSVFRMEAGGGRVAFESGPQGVRILTMDARGGQLVEVARSRDDGRGVCGGSARLLDVSSSGEVLYESTTVPCPSRRGRYTLSAQSADGTLRTLLSRRVRRVYLRDQPPFRQLEGDQLVTWGDRLVRVRDLATGRVRRFVPRARFGAFGEPAVAADGHVLLVEFRDVKRTPFPLQTIRLVRPSGASEVVHRRQRVYGEPHFCGDRAVLRTFNQRGRLRLSLLDPKVPVFEGVMDPEALASCDARHFVLLTVDTGGGDDDGERAYVYALPK